MGRRDPLPADTLAGVHVLVIDDDDDARDLIRTVLSYAGALVSVAGGADDALQVLERVVPDVVVCDISMPEHDGYWFVQRLRAQVAQRTRDLPVVAVTAHGYVHGPDRTLPAGFQAHVRKPIDPWELCRSVAELVRK